MPFGGDPFPEDQLTSLVERIARAASKAGTLGAVGMTDAAKDLWKRIYAVLSEGHPGLFGSLTARAEPQVLRLALIYALLDEATVIDREHLLAAIAVWEYAEASARHIFGSAIGDAVADEIYRAARAAGVQGHSRTAIRDLFKRHQTSERIDAALELLARRNLMCCENVSTGGRPTEIWRCL